MKQTQTETDRLTTRDAAIRSMKQVVKHASGSPERWRAAFIHFMHQRPEAQAEAAFIASQVAERKKQMNDFASSAHGRAIMAQPSFLTAVLRATDPEYFINASAMDLISEAHLRKMKKAFPEYFYAEII
jgi:hypothetical protein